MPSHQGYQKVEVAEAARSGGGGGGVLTNLLLDHDDTMMDTAEGVEGGVGGGLPSTHSSQQLMPSDSSSVATSTDAADPEKMDAQMPHHTDQIISRMEMFTVMVLCFVNLINYMDRLTIAGECLFFSSRHRNFCF